MFYKKPDDVLADVIASLEAQRDEVTLHRKMMQVYESTYRSPEVDAQREQHNIEDREVNLSAAVMNSLLGYEEEQRKNWSLQSSDGKNPEIAEAMTAKVLEVARLSGANHSGSEAYKSAAVGTRGFEWLHYNSDPLGPPVIWEPIRRANIIPDMSSTHPSGKDMDFIAVRHFFGKHKAKALHPQHSKMIETMCVHIGTWEALPHAIQANTGSKCNRSMRDNTDSESSWSEMFFTADQGQRMVARTIIFYKRFKSKPVITWPDGRSELYDQNNLEHLTAQLTSGVSGVFVEKSPIHEIYKATYLGPYLIEDKPSDMPFNELPIVQTRGYQRDDTNICYGPMFYMLAPQLQVNDMEVRIMHLMHTRLTQVVQDEIGDDEDGIPLTMDEVQRRILSGEAIIPVKSTSAIQVDTHLQEIINCDKIRMQAIENLRNSAGISLSYSGLNDDASGVAQEQSSIRTQASLSEFDSNAKMTRQHKGHLMMMVARDMIGSQEHEIRIPPKNGMGEKSVSLNRRNDKQVVDNDLVQARLEVVLEEHADNESTRAYNLERWTKAFQSAAPGSPIQTILEPLILQYSGIPNVEEVLAEYYQMTGRGRTPEEKKEIQEGQQQKAAEERQILLAEKKTEILERQTKAVASLAKAFKDAMEGGIDARLLMQSAGLQPPEQGQQQDPNVVNEQQAQADQQALAEEDQLKQGSIGRLRSMAALGSQPKTLN